MLVGSSCGTPDFDGFVRATEMTSLADGVGGPKAIAQPGDILLENEHLKLAILGSKNSLGPGLRGGSLVDADLQRSDPAFSRGRGKDQFAEMFPTINMNVTDTDPLVGGTVAIVEDGSNGRAVVRVRGPSLPFLSLLDALWALVGAPDQTIQTDYVLEAGKSWLTIRTTAAFGPVGAEFPPGEPMGGSTDGMPLITWAIEDGVVAGEFFLQGGSVDVFAPGIGFDEDGAVYRVIQEQKNTFVDPFQFSFLAGVADGVSYGLAAKDGDLFVPLFTSSQTVAVGAGRAGDGTPDRFPTGSAFDYERYFFVGHGDIGSIVDQLVEAKSIPFGEVSGHVVERTTGQALSGVDVFVYAPGADYPWSQWETDVDPDDRAADGSFGGRLPVGEWELLVHHPGRPAGARVPITVREGGQVALSLDVGRSGVLELEVRDDVGRPLPSKVTLFRLDADPVNDPSLGDSFVGGDPESVVFTLDGTGEVPLAPGRYQAVATRGIEYEIATSEPFTIDENTGAKVDLVLVRSVDTTGWISADLHVHSVPSHDSGVGLADRVRTMAAEGVEFFAATDHDYVTDFAPTIEALGLEPWVQSAIGNEVTTVEIGHFLGFPLAHDFLAESGAGREEMDWTGKTPGSIVTTLREMGARDGYEPAVFVGHPRDGILGYFDQYGFDPYDGVAGPPGAPGAAAIDTPILSITNPLLAAGLMDWSFDGLELLNGKRLELLRTPTQPEMDAFAAGEGGVYDWMSRTVAEQQDLESGVYKLGYGWEGQIDDWFSLLNLGFRYTVLGNSDTHGFTSTEAGCPRNFVLSDTDDPAFLDDQAVADAVREHRVVASYGPFLQLWAESGGDEVAVGGELVASGEVNLTVEVQAPTWMAVDRIELYENGRLIQEWSVDDVGEVVKFRQTVAVTPAQDAWYVAIAMGKGDLGPLFSPVEIPYVELQMIVTEALGGVASVSNLLEPAVPIPREFPVHPFAITNPIWVDRSGDGFQASGIPDWFAGAKPVAP